MRERKPQSPLAPSLQARLRELIASDGIARVAERCSVSPQTVARLAAGVGAVPATHAVVAAALAQP